MKKILDQQKFKKLNNWKYKPKVQIKATIIEETENTENQHMLKYWEKAKTFARDRAWQTT